MCASVLMRVAAVAVTAAALAAQAWADPADDQYAVATGHYGRGRWQMAVDEFQVFLREHAQHPQASRAGFFLAEAWMQLRRYDEARTQFRTFLANADESSDLFRQATFRVAEAAYLLREYDEACREFELFQSRYPDDRLNAFVDPCLEQARLGHGWALLQLGEHPQARVQLEKLIDSPKLGIEARYVLGLTYRSEQNWTQAAEVFAAASGDDQHALAPAIVYYAGESEMRLGHSAAAVAQFDRLRSAWPDNDWADDALLARATICKTLGRWEDSLSSLDEYLAAYPDTARAGRCRALRTVCLAGLKRFSEARAALDSLRAAQIDEDLLLSTIHDVAQAAYRAGELAWASELFTVLGNDKYPPEIIAQGLAGLAWCQFDMQRYDDAEATCQRLLTAYPQATYVEEIMLLHGQSCERLNRPDPALSMYLSLIEQHPGSEHLLAALLAAARLQDRLQQDEQAIALYERLQREFGDRPESDVVLYESAWVLRDLGRDAEADELLSRLHHDFPQSTKWADATYRLAERAYLRKDFEQTRGLLTRLEEADDVAAELRQHALYLSARISAAEQQWDKISSPLGRLLAEYPDTPLRLSAEYWIAESDYRRGDYAQATEHFAQLASLPQGRGEPWMVMIPLRHAQCLAQQDRWAEAKQIAARIAEDFPGSTQQYEADYLLGRCLAADAQFEAARQAYLRVIRSAEGAKTETAAMAQWMIGETYFHQKNYGAALREYLRVEILYAWPTWQAAALLQAGKCQELLGNWPQAAEHYARLLKEHPESTFVEEAGRRLQAAEQQINPQGSKTNSQIGS